jgi:predicted CoA-binding protein
MEESDMMAVSEITPIFEDVRREGRTELTEPEAKQVLASAGLTITQEELTSGEDEAVASAERIGFPVVLKIASPDILHKSDAGGVQIGLADAQAVRQGYQGIMEAVAEKHPSARIHGVLVQEMVQGGIETIVGVTNRPPFGPVVAFGLGGVFVELLKDITFRLAPLDEAGAAEMLDEIKGASMLEGYRGQPAANKGELAKAIARLSELVIELSEDVEELDINPLVIKGDRVIAVDALIALKAPETGDQPAPIPKPHNKNRGDIRAVLEPRSIAVIGASPNPEKTGHVLFKNIIVNGFPGKVYPINPKGGEILGHKAYPKILDVPGDIDLVFFLLPGEFIATLFEDCKKKGVKAAVIIAAGGPQLNRVHQYGSKTGGELHPVRKLGGWAYRCRRSIGDFRRGYSRPSDDTDRTAHRHRQERDIRQ